MDVSGIIFASIDTDVDAIESWNRWYDLEHLPPNVALPGIMYGRRYVAPPELQEVRLPDDPMRGFEGGRGTHVTIYTLSGDPAKVIADMTTRRDELEAQGRMEGAGRRVVRAGDALSLAWAVADPVLLAGVQDVPHIAHTGVRVVFREGPADAGEEVATRAVGVPGVHAVMGLASALRPGTSCDVYLVEGDPAAVTLECRDAAPYGEGSGVVLDAPFRLIVPFDYSFAERIRASDMPRTID